MGSGRPDLRFISQQVCRNACTQLIDTSASICEKDALTNFWVEARDVVVASPPLACLCINYHNSIRLNAGNSQLHGQNIRWQTRKVLVQSPEKGFKF